MKISNVHSLLSDILLFRFVLLLTRTEIGEAKSKKIKTNKYYISVFNFKVLYKTLPLSKKLISVWSQKSGVWMPLFTFLYILSQQQLKHFDFTLHL